MTQVFSSRRPLLPHHLFNTLQTCLTALLHMGCCCHVQVFSQDRLMLATAASAGLSRAMAGCLLPQMLRLTRREEILRLQLWSAGEAAVWFKLWCMPGFGVWCRTAVTLLLFYVVFLAVA
jgi:hypothetical protein